FLSRSVKVSVLKPTYFPARHFLFHGGDSATQHILPRPQHEDAAAVARPLPHEIGHKIRAVAIGPEPNAMERSHRPADAGPVPEQVLGTSRHTPVLVVAIGLVESVSVDEMHRLRPVATPNQNVEQSGGFGVGRVRDLEIEELYATLARQ